MSRQSEPERMYRIGEAIRYQGDLEYAREFEADAAEAVEAGFPDVAEEALAEARECRQSAARHRREATTSWAPAVLRRMRGQQR